MKKLIFNLGLVLTLSTSLFSCNKKTTSPTQDNSIKNNSVSKSQYLDLTADEKILEFEIIGKKHNDGLDYAFQYLQDNAVPEMSKGQLKSLVQTGIESYLSNQLNNDEMTWAYSYSNNIFTNLTFNLNLELYSTNLELSSDCIALFESLDDICDGQWDISEIESLEYQAIKDLSDNEEIVFLSATSVAKATISYWNQNYAAWDNIIDIDLLASPKNVGKADVGGAVGGVMTYWWLGGPVGWIGSAVGGACIASAAAVFA